MFSNQYMGTRSASRNLSRAASTTVYNQAGPYSRLNTQAPQQKPVNARDNNDDEPEEVDYSFMNLPVRERRKLFLSGGQASSVQRGYHHSLTMPRKRTEVNSYHNRFETQSEYGGTDHNTYGWDIPVTPTWVKDYRSTTSSYEPVKSRSTKTFSLASTPAERPVQQQFTQYVAAPPSPRYNQSSSPSSYFNTVQPKSNYTNNYPQYSATIHVHEPSGRNNSPIRVYNGNSTRIYSSKQYSSRVSPARTITPTTTYQSYSQPNSVSRGSGRIVQPLRINVYNSENASTVFSPHRKTENTPNWNPSSPIYPAYPAHMDKSNYTDFQPLRYRREQSVRPMTIYTTNNPVTNNTIETRQVWKSVTAQNIPETNRTVRSGTFITTTKKLPGGRRPDFNSDQPGVSEF
uniref:Uncharacterized protein n=1 Tax=Trichobilharzia regenti TaxID=157069 RepID=A0AA85JL08_TRIRE|nr:unnamed protein product [Trichobilharzia regenti]